MAVDPLLNDDDQEYNRQLTWEALMRLPLETLEARAPRILPANCAAG